jgi:hypothetical protein
MADLAGPLADGQIIGALVDGVQPVVEMVQDRKAALDQFNSEGFRSELSEAVQAIADLQMALTGHVGPGITRLQMQLETANTYVLFALSETPLVELIDLTQGLSEEIASFVNLTNGAISDIESSYSAQQVVRFTSLGMSAVAPAYVSCGFVLENVQEQDITNLNLIRLRMKQISGVSKIAIEVLPKAQTIGVTAVGGATLSIPNPIIPMVSAIKKITDKYYDVSEDWTDKYDDCAADALQGRLEQFLVDHGY